MEYFAGLDVSMEETHICVLDREGEVVHEAKVASTPTAITYELAKAPACRCVVFEMPAQIARQSDDSPLLVRAFHKAGLATLMPLARADEFVVIPTNCAEVKPDDTLKFMPFPHASSR